MQLFEDFSWPGNVRELRNYPGAGRDRLRLQRD